MANIIKWTPFLIAIQIFLEHDFTSEISFDATIIIFVIGASQIKSFHASYSERLSMGHTVW